MTDDSRVQVLISRLDPDLPMPRYAHPGDAGVDLHAREDVSLAPGERALVPTGIAIALPAGYAAFVHPRSGLAARHGITMVNAPGTIDAGYRGEILTSAGVTGSPSSWSNGSARHISSRWSRYRAANGGKLDMEPVEASAGRPPRPPHR